MANMLCSLNHSVSVPTFLSLSLSLSLSVCITSLMLFDLDAFTRQRKRTRQAMCVCVLFLSETGLNSGRGTFLYSGRVLCDATVDFSDAKQWCLLVGLVTSLVAFRGAQRSLDIDCRYQFFPAARMGAANEKAATWCLAMLLLRALLCLPAVLLLPTVAASNK